MQKMVRALRAGWRVQSAQVRETERHVLMAYYVEVQRAPGDG